MIEKQSSTPYSTNQGKLSFHPACEIDLYHRYRRQLFAMALGGLCWAFLIFSFTIQTDFSSPDRKNLAFSSQNSFPHLFPIPIEGAMFSFPMKVCLVYSYCTALHSIYIILGLTLSRLLFSKTWMRVTALGTALPGPAFLFGLPQFYTAVKIFRDLRHPRWEKFFAWRLKGEKRHNVYYRKLRRAS